MANVRGLTEAYHDSDPTDRLAELREAVHVNNMQAIKDLLRTCTYLDLRRMAEDLIKALLDEPNQREGALPSPLTSHRVADALAEWATSDREMRSLLDAGKPGYPER